MINAGIDAITFVTSHYYLDLIDLAKARGIDSNKLTQGLGQQYMSVSPPGEDIVTLSACATHQLNDVCDLTDIDTLLFATESGVDQSKAAGVFLHSLLELPSRCSVIELKQACYSATAAIQLAVALIQRNPESKVLVIAADQARYSLGSVAESSQGCAAVAMLITANPRVLVVDAPRGIYTQNINDFFRPNYSDVGIIDGILSIDGYLTGLEKTWHDYQQHSKSNFLDHQYFCYHAPVPYLVKRAHSRLARINNTILSDDKCSRDTNAALEYIRQIGNSYSASLYVSLISLLDTLQDEDSNSRIGFYSYGSGAVAEYFSGVLQAGYRSALNTVKHRDLFNQREPISMEQYESWHQFTLPTNGSQYSLPEFKTGLYCFDSIDNHQRFYKQVVN